MEPAVHVKLAGGFLARLLHWTCLETWSAAPNRRERPPCGSHRSHSRRIPWQPEANGKAAHNGQREEIAISLYFPKPIKYWGSICQGCAKI